ncbi:MAG: hypothetical protein IKV94_01330 [Clostridia bacterium]|nr:hypothetical protein [Clostridia bacterium]
MDEKKIISKAKSFTIILGLIYLIITILATVSAFGDISNNSSTEAGIGTIFSLIWFQLVIVVAFLVVFLVYNIKGRLGILFELILGIALFLNVVINMLLASNFTAIALLNFVIPLVVLVHSFLILLKIYKANRKIKLKELFGIK